MKCACAHAALCASVRPLVFVFFFCVCLPTFDTLAFVLVGARGFERDDAGNHSAGSSDCVFLAVLLLVAVKNSARGATVHAGL